MSEQHSFWHVGIFGEEDIPSPEVATTLQKLAGEEAFHRRERSRGLRWRLRPWTPDGASPRRGRVGLGSGGGTLENSSTLLSKMPSPLTVRAYHFSSIKNNYGNPGLKYKLFLEDDALFSYEKDID